ncbi:hypothetical protein OIU79_015742 [Salix purpurea]|uniref:Uncharacterized protein n=1 Tax=Salix purpurea TaxID=77065 RepID=A0A9Q0PCU0_SALPP|nr:hypothetical protein OIU79_015742 [Salix purpurea]
MNTCNLSALIELFSFILITVLITARKRTDHQTQLLLPFSKKKRANQLTHPKTPQLTEKNLSFQVRSWNHMHNLSPLRMIQCSSCLSPSFSS